MYDEEKHINLSDRNKNFIDDNYMIYRSYEDYMKEYIEVRHIMDIGNAIYMEVIINMDI